MATPKKGQFVKSVEWAKHLRKFGKREFWSKERAGLRNNNSKIEAELTVATENDNLDMPFKEDNKMMDI